MSTYASNANYSHPKLPADIIRRPRLLRLLHENVDRKLIAVAAGPGYGKTTLLSQFADELDFPVCWVALSPWNLDPTAFVESIVWSIQTQFPEFGHATLSRIRSMNSFEDEIPSLVNVLLRDMEDNVSDYFAVVLDDFHVVESNASITRFVSDLATFLPEHAHIALSSRNKPAIPALARLVLNREAFYLTSSVMKFTTCEAQQLLELVMNKKLDPVEVKKINERIEGWAAALILLAQGDAMEVPVDDEGNLLIEYLEQEVLTSHPAHIQAFLTLTSLFPVLVPENCNKLLGIENSQAILQELERCNLVREEVLEGNSVYRYHSLLREFLQQKLEAEQGERLRSFAIRTASLLESADFWHEAFDVCCQVGAFEPAAALVARICPELVEQGKWSIISQIIGMLPEECVANHFELMVWQSQAMRELGDLDAALETVNRALRSFDRLSNPSQFAWGLINKSVVLRHKSRMDEAEAACLHALDILKDTAEPERLEARAHHNIGLTAYFDGKFIKAAEHLLRALKGYEEFDEVNFASQAHDTLGAVYTDTGKLGDAIAHYNQALTGFQKVKNDRSAVLTLSNLGNAYFYMADYGLAQEVLSDAISKASTLELDRYEAYAQVSLADIKRAIRRTDEALSAYERGVELARESGETRLVIYALEGQALSYLDSNDVDRTGALLEEASALAAQNKFDRHANLLLISHSMVARREGFHEKAIDLLGKSLKFFDDKIFPMEHCRARIHLAYTYHISRDYSGARTELERVGEILTSRPDPYFLVPDLINMPGLLEFATEMQSGNAVYRMLSQKVGRISNDNAPQEPRVESSQINLTTDRYPAISIEGFGLAKVMLDGEEVTRSRWRSNKAKELVLYLAQLGRPASKDEVIAALWPDVDHHKGISGLKSNLHRARKALYTDCLVNNEGWCEFSPKGDFSFDVDDYVILLDHADKLPESIRPASIEGAVEIYRGPFMPELYSDWCSEERDRLEARQLQSLAALADHYSDKGNFSKAAHLTQEILRLDPYNEHAAELTIRYLARSGNVPGATYFYRWYVQFLDRELGLQPSDHISSLYKSLFPVPLPAD